MSELAFNLNGDPFVRHPARGARRLSRDQVLQLLVTGMRVLLGQGSPIYRTAPLHRPTHTAERAG